MAAAVAPVNGNGDKEKSWHLATGVRVANALIVPSPTNSRPLLFPPSGYAPCSDYISHHRLSPPTGHPSPAASLRGPRHPSSLGFVAASAHLYSGQTATAPLWSPRAPPRWWWHHSGSRPEARRTPQCCAHASRVRSGAHTSACS